VGTYSQRGRDGIRLQVHFKGARDKYVEGGIHMTNSAFFPIAVLKDITGTEYKRNISGFFNRIFHGVNDLKFPAEHDLQFRQQTILEEHNRSPGPGTRCHTICSLVLGL
jgi:hypothetical protein